jgi:hypothetical protein
MAAVLAHESGPLSPYFVTRIAEGFNYFVASIVAPVASGWSICRGGALTPRKAPPFHGARRKRKFVTIETKLESGHVDFHGI